MRILSWLCWISLALVSCKKELNSDFDPIIGKWKWVKTIHGWEETGGTAYHQETVASANSSSDSYYIEFAKKGKLITFKNSKVVKKYRIKDYETGYSAVGKYWGYALELSSKTSVEVDYYNQQDTIVINGFFPKTKSDYGIPEDQQGTNMDNYFIREREF